MTDLHSKSPGQSQYWCELYIDILRGIIEHQNTLINDLLRRRAGDPLDSAWIEYLMKKRELDKTGSE